MIVNSQLLADNFTKWIDDLRTGVGKIFSSFSMNSIAILICVLFMLMTLITFIIVMNSVESKSIKTFTKMYGYLTRHPEISKDNIVEFNKLMKARFVPASIRVQWQNYMVNRAKKPSEFLSEDRIVDKPLKASKYKTTVKFYNFISLLIAGIGFLLGLFYYWGASVSVLDALFLSALSPMAILILTVVVNAIVSYRYNTIVTYLYENVEALGKLVDSACVNMPEFVDYEILFTAKEIRKGIPVLQEFLRQRAKKEQEAIENAKQSEVESEKYSFEDLGVDGALVMDKAMKESEHYLSNRRRYLAEIEQIETEKDMLNRNFDDKSKVSQRKLRDIKDNQQRLKEKIDTTTNKIMANELRKQQADEVKKQQAVEKEIDEDNEKHLQEVKKLDEEIDKRKEEIEKAKRYVENVLKSEFKTYSDKIYNTLSDEVGENLSVQMVKFNKEKAELEQRINENNNFVSERDALFQDKLAQIEELNALLVAKDNEIQALNENITNAQQSINTKHKDRKDLIDALNIRNKQCQELTDAVSERDKVIKKQEEIIKDMTFAMEQEKHKFAELKNEKETEIHHYYDALGREFFYDINDRPFFYDETGKVVYYDEANLDHLIKLDKKAIEMQMDKAVNNIVADNQKSKQPEPREEKEEVKQPVKEEIKNEEDKPSKVYVANENFFDDLEETSTTNNQSYDDFFKEETPVAQNKPLENKPVENKPEVIAPEVKPQVVKPEQPVAKPQPVVQPVKEQSKVVQSQPAVVQPKVEQPKTAPVKTSDELSIAQRRAERLARMREERQKLMAQKPVSAQPVSAKPAATFTKPAPVKPVASQPKAAPVQKPIESKPSEKQEPEKSLAQKRQEKLAQMRAKNLAQKAPVKPKAATGAKQETPKTQPAKVSEVKKPEPKAAPAKTNTSSSKKPAKKEFLSDAEVFEQAFKDLDMAAFNEKLSNVFEQIDAQAKANKKKK